MCKRAVADNWPPVRADVQCAPVAGCAVVEEGAMGHSSDHFLECHRTAVGSRVVLKCCIRDGYSAQVAEHSTPITGSAVVCENGIRDRERTEVVVNRAAIATDGAAIGEG